MSRVQPIVRRHACRDTEAALTQRTEHAVSPRDNIQQATIPPAPSSTPTVVPTAEIDSLSTIATPSPEGSQGQTQPVNSGMSSATKIGLGMIPIILLTVGMYILFLFWYRKRRAIAIQKSLRGKPPPVPKKDSFSSSDSLRSIRRTSKVFQMSAFSTPIYDRMSRGSQVYGQARRHGTSNGVSNKRGVVDIDTSPLPWNSPHMVEVENDSPIDGSSPFRLKRGDTVKRLTIGPDLAKLWPSPPPSAWIKPTAGTTDQDSLSSVRRESSIYQDSPDMRML